MEAILDLVKSIVIFTFLTTILEQLISDSAMQKYIRFFFGILFCVLLLHGVLAVFKKQDFMRQLVRLPQEYTKDNMDDMFLEQEAEMEQKITEEYEKQEEKNQQKQIKSNEKSKQDKRKIEIPKIIIEGEKDGE